MAWRTLSAADAAAKFTPSELAMLYAQKGATTGLSDVLTAVIRKFQGAIAATGALSLSDGQSVPDQLRDEVLAYAVWKFLLDFPGLELFKTKGRSAAFVKAETDYSKICDRTYGSIESPYGTDVTTGNWNSQPKLIGRMGQVPPPSMQLSPLPTPLYANPNAPPDTVPTNTPQLPNAPVGLELTAGNGFVMVEWDAVAVATTYNLYRGTVAGQETLYQPGLTLPYYLDQGVANGTQYLYYVRALNAAGTSAPSQELSATPQATLPP